MALIQGILLGSVVLHIWMAVLLTLENKKAKPAGLKSKVQSSYAARTMRMSGVIVFAFIIFHILHYTTRVVPSMEYNDGAVFTEISGGGEKLCPTLYKEGYPVLVRGETVQTFNVYDMLIHGFKNKWLLFSISCRWACSVCTWLTESAVCFKLWACEIGVGKWERIVSLRFMPGGLHRLCLHPHCHTDRRVKLFLGTEYGCANGSTFRATDPRIRSYASTPNA